MQQLWDLKISEKNQKQVIAAKSHIKSSEKYLNRWK